MNGHVVYTKSSNLRITPSSTLEQISPTTLEIFACRSNEKENQCVENGFFISFLLNFYDMKTNRNKEKKSKHYQIGRNTIFFNVKETFCEWFNFCANFTVAWSCIKTWISPRPNTIHFIFLIASQNLKELFIKPCIHHFHYFSNLYLKLFTYIMSIL